MFMEWKLPMTSKSGAKVAAMPVTTTAVRPPPMKRAIQQSSQTTAPAASAGSRRMAGTELPSTARAAESTQMESGG
jgi:hypothetical protein